MIWSLWGAELRETLKTMEVFHLTACLPFYLRWQLGYLSLFCFFKSYIKKPFDVLLKHRKLLIAMAALVHKVTGTVSPVEKLAQMHHFAKCSSSMPVLVCLLNRHAFWKLPFCWPHSIPHITCLVMSFPFPSVKLGMPEKRRKFTIERKWKVFILCLLSEAPCQTHILGSSAMNTHGRLSESGESKWTVGPERDREIRVICNERPLICCKRNARSHIKEDF